MCFDGSGIKAERSEVCTGVYDRYLFCKAIVFRVVETETPEIAPRKGVVRASYLNDNSAAVDIAAFGAHVNPTSSLECVRLSQAQQPRSRFMLSLRVQSPAQA